jgi:hypothetical protein
MARRPPAKERESPKVVTLADWLSSALPIEREHRYRRFMDVYPELKLPPGRRGFSESDAVKALFRAYDFHNERLVRLMGFKGLPGILRHTGPKPDLVEHYEPLELHVPLFEFSAPPITGCEVTVTTKASTTTSAKWKIAVGPVGAGHNERLLASVSATYRAGAGERKQIFIAVPGLKVYRLNLTDLGTGETPARDITFRTDPHSHPISEVAVKSLPTQAGPALAAPLVKHYLLAHDTTRSLVTIEYTYTRTKELNVDVDASVALPSTSAEASFGASASVALEDSLILHFALITGHNYNLYQLGSEHGIQWGVED